MSFTAAKRHFYIKFTSGLFTSVRLTCTLVSFECFLLLGPLPVHVHTCGELHLLVWRICHALASRDLMLFKENSFTKTTEEVVFFSTPYGHVHCAPTP